MTTHLRAIFENGQLRLLDPVDLQEGQEVNIAILGEEKAPQGQVKLTAQDLLKLPLDERGKYLASMAAQAEEDYRSDPNLTGFEAFGEEDLYDETP